MPVSILLAKMGLDSHDTGIVSVAHMLRNSGYEVTYLGLHNSPEDVVNAAIQEDVAAIGISFLSGQHMTQMRHLLQAVEAAGLETAILCGGVIPRDDADELKAMGVDEIIFPGTLTSEVVAVIDKVIAGKSKTLI